MAPNASSRRLSMVVASLIPSGNRVACFARLGRWRVTQWLAAGRRTIMANGAGARRAYEAATRMARRAFHARVSAAERKAGLGMVEAAEGELLSARRDPRTSNDAEKHDQKRD